MHARSPAYLIMVASVVAVSSVASAQQHFSFAMNTGNNMTVAVPASINPTVDGNPLSSGDEIGVFTSYGLCVGAVVWNNANAAITVWGDDEQTAAVDGVAVGDTLRFRMWDASKGAESPATVGYASGAPTYSVDGMSVLGSLNPTTRARQFVETPKSGAKGSIVKVFTMAGKICNRSRSAVSVSNGDNRVIGGTLPRGNYLIVFEADGAKTYRKVSVLNSLPR